MNNIFKNTPQEFHIFVIFLVIIEIRTDLPKMAKPIWQTKIKIVTKNSCEISF